MAKTVGPAKPQSKAAPRPAYGPSGTGAAESALILDLLRLHPRVGAAPERADWLRARHGLKVSAGDLERLRELACWIAEAMLFPDAAHSETLERVYALIRDTAEKDARTAACADIAKMAAGLVRDEGQRSEICASAIADLAFYDSAFSSLTPATTAATLARGDLSPARLLADLAVDAGALGYPKCPADGGATRDSARDAIAQAVRRHKRRRLSTR